MPTLVVHNLDQHPTAPYPEFVDVQGDFKDYADVPKLAQRIQQAGFKYDFLVWVSTQPEILRGQAYPPGTKFIVDAHARQRALQMCAEAGWTVPPVPFTRVAATTLAEAQEELLFLNSRYGAIQPDSEFLAAVLANAAPPVFDTFCLSELEAFDSRSTVALLPDDQPDGDHSEEISAEPGDTSARYPLAVVLTAAQYAAWGDLKTALGVKTDTQAVLHFITTMGTDV